MIKNNAYVIKSYIDFSMIAIPQSVEQLIFDKEFGTELPALFDFCNLKELVIMVPISWQYIAELKIPSLEKLSFIIDDKYEVCTLIHENLKSLKIYNISKKDLTPIEKLISSSILTGYDFSNLTKLESLSLDYFLGFDFNKTKFPKSLLSLKITHSEIQNVDWCLTVKNLENINLDYNNISDINLLSYMPNLKKLSLKNNDIQNAIFLSSIDGLKYLNLLNNPIIDADKLKNISNINTLLIDQKDYELYMLKNLAYSLPDLAKNFMENYDHFIQNRSTYIQMQNLKEQSMEYNKRLKQYCQMEFEYYFYRINPFNHNYLNYSAIYKKLFIEFAKKYNNNLIIKDEQNKIMYHELELEKKGLDNIYKSGSGIIFIVSDTGLYRLKLEKKKGTGKLYFNDNQVNERLKNVLIRSTILTICKTAQKDNAIIYDYFVDIKSLYSQKPNSSICLGITIGIFCLINKIEMPTDTVIYGQLNTRGSLKKIEIKTNILPLLEKIGIKRIITGKTTQKALNLITDSLNLNIHLHCCNKLDDMLNYINDICKK